MTNSVTGNVSGPACSPQSFPSLLVGSTDFHGLDWSNPPESIQRVQNGESILDSGIFDMSQDELRSSQIYNTELVPRVDYTFQSKADNVGG